MVGVLVGLEVGVEVGEEVGVLVGSEVGVEVGEEVGEEIGEVVGLVIGERVGLGVGAKVGLVVGSDVVGAAVGPIVEGSISQLSPRNLLMQLHVLPSLEFSAGAGLSVHWARTPSPGQGNLSQALASWQPRSST